MKKLNIRIPCYMRIADISEGKRFYCSSDDYIVTQDGRVFINPNGNATLKYSDRNDMVYPIIKVEDSVEPDDWDSTDIMKSPFSNINNKTYLYKDVEKLVEGWYEFEVNLDEQDGSEQRPNSPSYKNIEYDKMLIDSLMYWFERWIYICQEALEDVKDPLDISSIKDFIAIVEAIKGKVEHLNNEELLLISKTFYDYIWEEDLNLTEESVNMIDDLQKIVSKRLVEISDINSLSVAVLLSGEVDLTKVGIEQLNEMLKQATAPGNEDYDMAVKIREEINSRK